MSPLFAERAKVATARSISATSRTLTGLTSTPSDGAMDWMAANCAGPAASAGSRRTAARVTLGATSLSSSSHFALRPYSKGSVWEEVDWSDGKIRPLFGWREKLAIVGSKSAIAWMGITMTSTANEDAEALTTGTNSLDWGEVSGLKMTATRA